MTVGQLEYLVKKQVLRLIHPNVYVVNEVPVTWHVKAMAAMLSVPGSAISFGAAAKLHGLTFASSNQIELTAPGSHKHARDGVIVHRSLQLAPYVTTVNSILATIPERTIVDVSRHLTWKQVGAVMDQARILKLATAKSINDCVDQMSTRGYRRVGSLRTALEYRLNTDTDIDSFLEKRTLGWMQDHGFPMPETQVWYRKCAKPYRLDIWYADRKINVEPNGPHHLLPSYALEDAKRDAQLSTQGVLVIRVPLEMEEHEFIDLLKTAFLNRPLSVLRR